MWARMSCFALMFGMLVGTALAQTEVAKLTASDAAADDRFGYSVAVSGDLAVIGAIGDDGLSGSAYVYRYDPPSGNWIEEAKLTASDAATGGTFGYSVSVSGDVAVIGAKSDDDEGSSSGSAYVYRYDLPSGNWIEEAKLTASDAARGDTFGYSVSVSSDLALIGAFGDDDGCPPDCDSGAAYLYRYDPPSGNWIEEAKLTASDASHTDYFGYSVSVSGALAMIGAYQDDDGARDAGSAYVYRYDPPSGDWIEEAKLTASDAAADDRFGWSVSVSSEVAVIGANWDDDAGSNSGSAYVYRYDPPSGDWIEEAKLTASDPAADDEFGTSVSVSGDLTVIGVPFDDDAGTDSGSSYVYGYDSSSGDWIEEGKLTASDAATEDTFGWSVSVSNGVAVTGAKWDDDGGSKSGSAYVYEGLNSILFFPEGLTIIRGRQVAGELTDLFDSDDFRIVFQPGITLNPDEPPVWLLLDGTSPMDTPSILEFTLETQVDTPNVTQTVELFNYVSQEFEEVDSRVTPFNEDGVVEIVVDNDPGRFIDPETLQVKAQLTWKPPPLVLVYPWSLRIDQAVWRVTP